ncbi:MAG: hypothetical protein AMJ81_00430 [Phycisphaerae bacterium SM23_33]|nr:MAG: hypothetical protein AMJ81_00430 [Phycisphaerae bacterium SM23_33]
MPGSRSVGLNRLIANNDIAFAIGLAVVLATLLVPLPTYVLDMLLACSIAVALATMVIVLSARESIEIPAFPSLLLLVTLFRLSLNVASTRLILLQANAGDIINTFGQIVVGNVLTVGLVIFLILVVIQYIVITKGAERISEVAARFNLDAMPGKQMSIDADLNAGLIGEEEARQRRQKIVRESEFYGAMDGASKFIRGDAIAGLIITAINLIGGFVMGLTRGMTYGESIRSYSILAIGDGLVTQIPAVIISTSAGFLISKTSTDRSLSHDLVHQALAKSRPLGIAAFLFGAMVFVPGFPKLPFVMLALGSGLLARRLSRAEKEQETAVERGKPAPDIEQVTVEEALDVDKICVLVGPRLVKAIDPRRKDNVSHRITPLRRKFAQQYGIVLPLVRLRDNVSLDPNAYEIRLYNHLVGQGRLEPDKFLAMDPGTVQKPISGDPTREPVFDLPALWIRPEQKEEAEVSGYTVVDPESVLVTHLSETLRRHAYELLSRDDVQKMVNCLREKQPALVDSVIGDLVPIGLLHRVLQNLLRDGIPIRDLAQILEVLGDSAHRTKDPAVLTELARKALVRTITEKYADVSGRIIAITLEPALEYELSNSTGKEAEGEMLSLAPDRALALVRAVSEAWQAAMEKGHEKVVLLCDYRVRLQLANMVCRQVPQLPVLAYDEIAIGTKIDSVGVVSLTGQLTEAGALT